MQPPLLLSTWSFSAPILESEYPNLENGNSSLDTVEACVRKAESDVAIESVGFGGLPDQNGNCTFDAMVMTSPSCSGAVCGIERHLHPVSIARLVMEKTDHTLLAGPLADDFADLHRMDSSVILAEKSKAKWEDWQKNSRAVTPTAPFDYGDGDMVGSHDTICTLALDNNGILAGACSTSGMAWKVPGRVGDSPIIGHGLYVDPTRGAAAATGHGELISGINGSFLVVELMGRGATPEEAIRETLARLEECWVLKEEHQVAFIATTPAGQYAGGALRAGFKYAICTSSKCELVEPEVVMKS